MKIAKVTSPEVVPFHFNLRYHQPCCCNSPVIKIVMVSEVCSLGIKIKPSQN